MFNASNRSRGNAGILAKHLMASEELLELTFMAKSLNRARVNTISIKILVDIFVEIETYSKTYMETQAI